MILKAEETDVKSCKNSINERVAKNIAKFAVPGQFEPSSSELQGHVRSNIYFSTNLRCEKSSKDKIGESYATAVTKIVTKRN